jgi:hypothetical protein
MTLLVLVTAVNLLHNWRCEVSLWLIGMLYSGNLPQYRTSRSMNSKGSNHTLPCRLCYPHHTWLSRVAVGDASDSLQWIALAMDLLKPAFS